MTSSELEQAGGGPRPVNVFHVELPDGSVRQFLAPTLTAEAVLEDYPGHILSLSKLRPKRLPVDTVLLRWNKYYVHADRGGRAASVDLQHERKSLRALHRMHALSGAAAAAERRAGSGGRTAGCHVAQPMQPGCQLPPKARGAGGQLARQTSAWVSGSPNSMGNPAEYGPFSAESAAFGPIASAGSANTTRGFDQQQLMCAMGGTLSRGCSLDNPKATGEGNIVGDTTAAAAAAAAAAAFYLPPSRAGLPSSKSTTEVSRKPAPSVAHALRSNMLQKLERKSLEPAGKGTATTAPLIEAPAVGAEDFEAVLSLQSIMPMKGVAARPRRRSIEVDRPRVVTRDVGPTSLDTLDIPAPAVSEVWRPPVNPILAEIDAASSSPPLSAGELPMHRSWSSTGGIAVGTGPGWPTTSAVKAVKVVKALVKGHRRNPVPSRYQNPKAVKKAAAAAEASEWNSLATPVSCIDLRHLS